MLKRVFVSLVCVICLSLIGCMSSGKNWKAETDNLFSDVEAMHSQILAELARPSRERGDYAAANKIIDQNAVKIQSRFSEIMAASRWEFGNDEKTALKEKMMEFPTAALDGIDMPYTGYSYVPSSITGVVPKSDQEVREAKDKFFRKYAGLFSGTAGTSQKNEPSNADIESKLKTKNSSVEFVDRSVIFGSSKPDPLLLIVGIAEDGKLKLNGADEGTIADPTILSQKIKAVFEERQKLTVAERGIVIDPKGKIKDEDMEKVVETLAAANASPIRIIKSSS